MSASLLAVVRSENNEGEATLLTRVGGVSLALRHLRVAKRAGFDSVTFVVPNLAERDATATLLQQEAQGTSVKFIEELAHSDSLETTAIAALGIYLPQDLREGNLKPAFAVVQTSDIKPAESFLFAQIRKSIALDGVIAFYAMRPLARVFTKLLLNTRVSPNQATLGALACGIGAAICAGFGGAWLAIWAGLLYWFGGVIDCIDGELARMRLQSSKIGEWLDSMVDEFSTLSLVIGLGIGLRGDGYGDYWLWLALGGAALAFVTLGSMYRDLHKMRLPIDTAQYPWFFGTSTSAIDQGETGIVSKIINFGGYFIRRDANITGTAILLILNLRQVSLSIILGAFVVAALLLITHYVALALRPSS